MVTLWLERKSRLTRMFVAVKKSLAKKMSFLEFFLINLFYICLVFAYRSEREYIWSKLTQLWNSTLPKLLGSPLGRQLVELLSFFRNHYPSIKKEGKMLHVSYMQHKLRYDVFLPYDRHLSTARKYACQKAGKTVREFRLPPGVKLFCTEKDFGCDEIISIE